MGVSVGRLIQGEFIVMFYGTILISFWYLRGGGLSAEGAITDFYGILATLVKNHLDCIHRFFSPVWGGGVVPSPQILLTAKDPYGRTRGPNQTESMKARGGILGHFCMFCTCENISYRWSATFYWTQLQHCVTKWLIFEDRPSDNFPIEIYS